MLHVFADLIQQLLYDKYNLIRIRIGDAITESH